MGVWTLEYIDKWKEAPLREKIEYAKAEIEHFIDSKHVIAFSGGKNSTVLLYLVMQYDANVTAVFNNTGVEFPETVKFVRWLAEKWGFNLVVVEPEMTFWEIVEKYGYPHHARYDDREPRCCYYLKTKPAYDYYREHEIEVVFLGMSAFESRARKLNFAHRGSWYMVKEGWIKSNPLVFWTDEDVFRFAKEEGIPLNPAYEKYGITRTGCLPCTGYLGWEKKLLKISPALYCRIQHERGQMLIEDYVGGGE